MSAVAVACLDLEGVLVPEIWINVAERTGIAALRRTTRDEPDYDKLMRGRLAHPRRARARPPRHPEGDRVASARSTARASSSTGCASGRRSIILSDTFLEFAAPLMQQLGWPTLFCHSLEVDAATAASPATACASPTGSAAAVRAPRPQLPRVAAGDSYNDTTMLGAADAGILFRPPENVIATSRSSR